MKRLRTVYYNGEMGDQRVDLICTDPSFNSGRNYNAFFKDSLV